MTIDTVFPYHWYVDNNETEYTSIRVYGINDQNANVCIRIDDFTPSIYIELPDNITWSVSKAQLLSNKLDEIMGRQKALTKTLVYRKKLYGVQLDHNGNRKSFPYLKCAFSHISDAKTLGYKLKNPLNIIGCGRLSLKVHETDANPILQLTCGQNISTAGWIQFKGVREVDSEMVTSCDLEYSVRYKNLKPLKKDVLPNPLVLTFDIEVNSHNPGKFPDPKVPGDKIFQISCVLSRIGSIDKLKSFLLTLGDPDETIVGDEVNIIRFDTEPDLIEGFSKFIREESPNIITGYNILMFDIPYLIDRSKLHMCFSDFARHGFHTFNKACEKTIKWSSSAYKNQEFQFLDAEGRLYVDLLPLVKRDYKLNNYKLSTVSEHFMGESKDPLNAQGIFKCFRIGTVRNEDGTYGYTARKAMAICGKYCVKDSVLVAKLIEKLKIWPGLTEMAATCQVPIISLYTQGQQIRVYSQVYKYCMYNNIVVEKDGYDVGEHERYTGAHVFPPVAGKYKRVVPFDFASLYPTTIIAYNIDYHTFVQDESIPDEMCNVMEWRDCIGCEHDPKTIRKNVLTEYIQGEQDKIDKIRAKKNKAGVGSKQKEAWMNEINVIKSNLKPYTDERAEINKTKPKFPMCIKRRYRFLKEPKGVLPTVLQNLLDARRHTRKVDMQACKDELAVTDDDDRKKELIALLDVLDKRQLAFKVSCNSMYGAMGVRQGYLPFMPGAMCTTFMGRVNIEKVAETIPSKFGGELVYGDTDSNYIHFPSKKTASETWDYALHVANELTKLFPPPIELEFENEIYDFFFILTKKRYMYRKCLRDGVVQKKIGTKGVILSRRDNSNFVRNTYEHVISMIADEKKQEQVVSYVVDRIITACSGILPLDDFVITKSVGDYANGVAEVDLDDKGNMSGKARVGEYKTPLLPNKNAANYTEELDKKNAANEREYYMSWLPPPVQLADRMKRRGVWVDKGSRLEYVVTKPDNHTDKQSYKIEDFEYMKKYSSVLSLDYFYYIKALANPLDQVLSVAFPELKDFVYNMYIHIYKRRYKLHRELKQMFSTIVKFIEK